MRETTAVLDAKPRMRLRTEPGHDEAVFFEYMRQIGKASDSEIADALGGLPRSVIWKLRNGKQRPSSEFIAAVKVHNPIVSMDRFFEAEVAAK